MKNKFVKFGIVATAILVPCGILLRKVIIQSKKSCNYASIDDIIKDMDVIPFDSDSVDDDIDKEFATDTQTTQHVSSVYLEPDCMGMGKDNKQTYTEKFNLEHNTLYGYDGITRELILTVPSCYNNADTICVKSNDGTCTWYNKTSLDYI